MHANSELESKKIEVPPEYVEQVAIDVSTNTVYVEAKTHWTPVFQTWLDRNKRSGVTLNVQHAERDEIAAMRQKGLRASESIAVDQENLQRAFSLLVSAAEYNASDIHLMMKGEHCEIQFDIKGGLRVFAYIGQDEGAALARAIYQGLAKTKDASWEQLESQNAQIPDDVLPPDLGLTSARIIRGPCYPMAKGGAFMTIRLQYSDTRSDAPAKKLKRLDLPRKPAGEFPMDRRGFTPRQVEKLRLLMSVPSGIIFVTGPTGSGKTALIYECLKEKARRQPHRRQVTVEDPVEFPMDWAVQLPVTDTRGDDENGAAFEDKCRTSLRMAPKTLLFGEVRGAGVAMAAIRGAQTGHDTWTTVHVADPFQTPERLEMMDPVRLRPKLICDPKTTRGYVGIRLLACLCKKCKVPLSQAGDAVPDRVIGALKTWSEDGNLDNVFVKGPGCEHCDYDGSTGRSAVAEVVINDDQLAEDFERGAAVARANYRARPDADPSMLEASIARVLRGEVEPGEVEEKVDVIEPRQDRSRTVVSLRESSAAARSLARADATVERDESLVELEAAHAS